MIKPGAWRGLTAACIASGPSLTPEDVELVRAAGLKTIAVNNSWQAARFCDVIYAGDKKWWLKYRSSIDIDAERWTSNTVVHKDMGINMHPSGGGALNSGLRAIELAIHFGAARVLLLGFDCMLTDGKTHWHGDHAGLGNPDARRFKVWMVQFMRLKNHLKGAVVVNCTRRTALRCFPMATLEEALCRT